MRSLLWIVIIIIVYGSLYPFHFVWVDASQIAWLDWSTQIRQRTTNGDLLSNLLTFIPLGYFAFAINATNSTRVFRKIAVILIGGGLFSLALQVVQFYTPSRIPSVGDAFFNFIGILLGCIAALGVQWWLRRNPQLALQWPKSVSVPLVMVVFWIVFQTFPFTPSFSIDSFKQNWELLFSEPFFLWSQWLFETVMWFCFIYFLQRLQNFVATNGKIILVVFAILISKLLIAHNGLNLTSVVAALSGVIAFRLMPVREWNWWHFAILCIVISIREMSPFEVPDKPVYFNLVPFRHYLAGSMWVNSQLILEKLFAYGSLIFIAIELSNDRIRATLLCLGAVLIIEVMRLVSNQHSADITDLLLVIVISYGFEQLRQTQMA